MSGEETSDTGATPGPDAREERYRIAAAAAGAPVLLFVAPFVTSVHGEESALQDAMRHGPDLVFVGALLAGPLFIGGMSLVKGLRRWAPPGLAAFAVPAVLYALAAAAIMLMAGAVVASKGPEPLLAAPGLLALAALLLILRGFRRKGWERWGQLVAGVWVWHLVLALLMALEATGFSSPALGPWLFLFALGAVAPIVGWALWPRRVEAAA
jgi:hypothetical protein